MSGADWIYARVSGAKGRVPKAITQQTLTVLSGAADLALWTDDEPLFRLALAVVNAIKAKDEAAIVRALDQLRQALDPKRS